MKDPYRLPPCQAESNSRSLPDSKPAISSVSALVLSHSRTSLIVSETGRNVNHAAMALPQSTSSMPAYSRGTHNGSSVNGSTPFSSRKSSETQTSSTPASPMASHSSNSVPICSP